MLFQGLLPHKRSPAHCELRSERTGGNQSSCVVQRSAHDECESLGSSGFCLPPMDGTSRSGETRSVSALHHEVRWKRAAKR